MTTLRTYETDVAIIGGGLAGIAAADELLRQGHRVLLIDKDVEQRFGGLARQSSGGVFLVWVAGPPNDGGGLAIVLRRRAVRVFLQPRPQRLCGIVRQ